MLGRHKRPGSRPSGGADGWRRRTCVTASSALRVCSTSHAAAVACVKGQVFSTSGKAGFSGAKAVEGGREPVQATPRANREVVQAAASHMKGGMALWRQAQGFLGGGHALGDARGRTLGAASHRFRVNCGLQLPNQWSAADGTSGWGAMATNHHACGGKV